MAPNSKEQRLTIRDVLKNKGKLVVGDTWNIISARWYKLWKEKVGFDGLEDTSDKTVEMDPIDNSDLLAAKLSDYDEQNRLKMGLQEDEDYVIIPAAVWNLLHSWYGGGVELPRQVILEGDRKVARVEVYTLRIKVMFTKTDGSVNLTSGTEVYISKKAQAMELKNTGCQLMDVNPGSVRLWNTFQSSRNPWGKQMKDLSKTLEDCTLTDGQSVLFEVQLDDGSWPNSKASKTSLNFSLKKAIMSLLHGGHTNGQPTVQVVPYVGSGALPDDPTPEKPADGNFSRGVCGLFNLGNTCFMNSALQCMSHANALTEYFLSGKFKNEINRNNPLGKKGQIAEQYGKLVKELWAANTGAVAPKNFKWALGKFAPQFSGYAQQDSQELLSFLLDGLHEDLNRVLKKPYVETIEATDQQEDAEIAQEMWEAHLKRNRSVIVDLFQGQLKSTLVCPVCNKVSITFDPFMYLSLPLPIPQHRVIDVVFVRYGPPKRLSSNGTSGSRKSSEFESWEPIRYSIKAKKKGVVEDLKLELSYTVNVSSKNLVLADVFGNRIYTFLNDARALSGIREKDLTIAYELPTVEPDTDITRVHLLHRKENKQQDTSVSSYMRAPVSLFGIPLVLLLPLKTMTGLDLYEMVWERVKRFMSATEGKEERKDRDKDTKKSSRKGGISSSGKHRWYPFLLRLVNGYGTACGRCSAAGISCPGCEVPCTDAILMDTPLGKVKNVTVLSSSSGKVAKPDWRDVALTVAIDWAASVLENEFDSSALEPKLDKSVADHRNESKKESLTLQDCLNMYITNERLGPDDPWYCPQCKSHQQAWKKLDVWSAPPILVVHLKRFQYDRYTRDKLGMLVDFPIHDLDLSNFILNKNGPTPKYELFAVSNHTGGLGGGHYTAFAKSKELRKWVYYNDSSFKQIDENVLVSSNAYLLFYQRVEPNTK